MTLQEIVEQLEFCNYECQGGKLENNVAFIELKRYVDMAEEIRKGKLDKPGDDMTRWGEQMEPLDDDINPGIIKTVLWLREHGFNTVNSGDGKTHLCECDADYPYVTILAKPSFMYSETQRLYELLRSIGIETGYMNEDGSGLAIECNYNPAWNHDAAISLIGVTDEMLVEVKDGPIAE
jgi:hypothetical protein